MAKQQRTPVMENPVIVTVDGGFYFYANLLNLNNNGFLEVNHLSMFGGFDGGKGLPGVVRNDPKATVILDQFDSEDEIDSSDVHLFPLTSVFAVHPVKKGKDLYTFKGATLR
jgi:hypothetical protein